MSRSPLGLRGLKCLRGGEWKYRELGRSPLGLRGLKYLSIFETLNNDFMSQPSWAAWIEIFFTAVNLVTSSVAALLGCVD